MAFAPKNIFEIHLSVSDRKISTEFYERVFGFTVARHIDTRDITFLWMNGEKSEMIGLWGPDCPDPPMSRGKSHIAFRLPSEEVIEAPKVLHGLGITPLDEDKSSIPFLNYKPTDEAVVLCWMPAVSIYFHDPDGHSLEFISMLQESPDTELGVVSFSEWMKR